MSNIQKKRSYILSRATFVTSFVVSIGLVVGGFFAPPMGIVDGSVLTAVGELLLFPTLLYAFRAVELGVDVKVTKGDASLEMTTDNGLQTTDDGGQTTDDGQRTTDGGRIMDYGLRTTDNR